MKAIPLLLLLVAVIATAQTTPITPATCIHLYNCVLHDTAGNTVWSDISWNSTTQSYQGFMEYGLYPNLSEFTELLQYPVANAVDPDPTDPNRILYSVQFRAPNGEVFTEALKGQQYYYRGGGGKGGGGAGWRYLVTSGAITVQ